MWLQLANLQILWAVDHLIFPMLVCSTPYDRRFVGSYRLSESNRLSGLLLVNRTRRDVDGLDQHTVWEKGLLKALEVELCTYLSVENIHRPLILLLCAYPPSPVGVFSATRDCNWSRWFPAGSWKLVHMGIGRVWALALSSRYRNVFSLTLRISSVGVLYTITVADQEAMSDQPVGEWRNSHWAG